MANLAIHEVRNITDLTVKELSALLAFLLVTILNAIMVAKILHSLSYKRDLGQ